MALHSAVLWNWLRYLWCWVPTTALCLKASCWRKASLSRKPPSEKWYFSLFFSFYKLLFTTDAGKAQNRERTAKHRELCGTSKKRWRKVKKYVVFWTPVVMKETVVCGLWFFVCFSVRTSKVPLTLPSRLVLNNVAKFAFFVLSVLGFKMTDILCSLFLLFSPFSPYHHTSISLLSILLCRTYLAFILPLSTLLADTLICLSFCHSMCFTGVLLICLSNLGLFLFHGTIKSVLWYFSLIDSKSEEPVGHLKYRIIYKSFHVTVCFLSWHVVKDFKETFILEKYRYKWRHWLIQMKTRSN